MTKAIPKKEAEAGKGAAGADATGADALKPGEGAWANFDFKPGERILYADDYKKDEVGDFPRSLEFINGSMEIVEWQGARYLRASSDAKFQIVLPQPLAERYTLEFDLAVPSGALWISPIDDEHKQRIEFHNGGRIGYHEDGRAYTGTEWVEAFRGKMYRARVMADGRYVKLYINDKRMANIPNGTAARGNKILFYVDGSQEQPALFGAFRLAAGGKKLYDALAEKGRVTTQGIYFDTGSDRIRPESTPTLKEIVAMLNDHADLKLTVEGHTDNVGNAAANQ
ncbi:MAG: OmpA family protein, partial [Rhodospirillaceae bacterium]|nr:OmpA family protein [Rhodospirillaceae bacterium]